MGQLAIPVPKIAIAPGNYIFAPVPQIFKCRTLMPLLAIVRHGQSVWNLENRFTGDIDVDLTPLGRDEARSAGRLLHGIPFYEAFTSLLKRAEETLAIILEETGHPELPVTRDKALNERCYGSLQGMNKSEMAEKYGAEQVAVWRRSYDVQPPDGESLSDTAARVIPYYRSAIEPLLRQQKNILVVAHGNSLRALMMDLEKISPRAIEDVEIATGVPRLYTMAADLRIENVKYL
jgi:2,3-bisphosphoglycerate-dependent phosphoglycerate mutase